MTPGRSIRGEVRMCVAADCFRTFNATGPQRYCRNRNCQRLRFQSQFAPEISEAVAEGLSSPEAQARELRDLIGEQTLDMRRGHFVERDSRRTAAVLSYDQTTDAIAKAYESSQGYVPDWWVPVVHATVDFWREIDGIAAALPMNHTRTTEENHSGWLSRDTALLQLSRRLPDSNRSKNPEEPPRLACKQQLSSTAPGLRAGERGLCDTSNASVMTRRRRPDPRAEDSTPTRGALSSSV